ncbi:hypothetical protein WJX74_000594 [Apatococcus lobatus]|uniref:Gamma-soluble NSF attachment protein n=2 Tax=Apatococcus TaxID=904362 RepID=A0AAW1SST9_9CHLO
MTSLEDADKLFKKASKLCTPSLLHLRLSFDWEQATPMFERAAAIYRTKKNLDKARQCYEKAATGQDRQGSPWHAGKMMEKAAEVCKEGPGSQVETAELYRQAAKYYAEAGRAQTSGESLCRGAKVVEDKDPALAGKLYLEAIEAVEDDGKEGLSGDMYRQAIAFHIRAQQWSDAVLLLTRFASACDSANLRSSQCRAYLSAVVVLLYAQDTLQAFNVYQDALGVSNFSSSDEAFVAEALFEAYRSQDAEEVKRVVKAKHVLSDLDNAVARLARQLPTGSIQMVQLGPSKIQTDDLDADDLT